MNDKIFACGGMVLMIPVFDFCETQSRKIKNDKEESTAVPEHDEGLPKAESGRGY